MLILNPKNTQKVGFFSEYLLRIIVLGVDVLFCVLVL